MRKEILSKIDNSEMEIDELAVEVQVATQLLRKCRQILIATEKNVQDALAELDGWWIPKILIKRYLPSR